MLSEIYQVAPFQRLDSGQGNGTRIAVCAIHDKFVVKMRRFCEPGGTDIADHLTLLDPFAVFDLAIGEMQVLGNDTVGMLYKHVMAVVLVICRLDDPAVTGCIDRCALGGTIVNAVMRLDAL